MSKSPMMRAISMLLSICMVFGMIYLPAAASEYDVASMTNAEVVNLCIELSSKGDEDALAAIEADLGAIRAAEVEALYAAMCSNEPAAIADSTATVTVYKQVSYATTKVVDAKYFEKLGTAADLEAAVTMIKATGANGGLIEISAGTLVVTNRQDITMANIIIKGAGVNATTITGDSAKFNNSTNGLANKNGLSSEYKAILGLPAENLKVMDLTVDGGACGYDLSFFNRADFKTVRINSGVSYLENVAIKGSKGRTNLMIGTSGTASVVYATNVSVAKAYTVYGDTEIASGSSLTPVNSILGGTVVGSVDNLGAGYYKISYNGLVAYTTIPYAIECYQEGTFADMLASVCTNEGIAAGTTVAQAMTADLTAILSGNVTLLYGYDCAEMKALAAEFKTALAGLSADTDVDVSALLADLTAALAITDWHTADNTGTCTNCGESGLEAPAVQVPAVDDLISNGGYTEEEKEVIQDVAVELKQNTALNDYTPTNLPENTTLSVVLTSMGVEGATAYKLTFEVSPKDSTGATMQPNGTVTFRLPIPASVIKTHANVYHNGDPMGTYKIQGEGNGKYVEVSTESFSEFTVETVNAPAAYIGTVGYETIQAAVNAAVDGDTVIVAEGAHNVFMPVSAADNYTGRAHNLFIGKNITVKGEEGKKVILYSYQETYTSTFDARITVLISGSDGVVLDNLTILPAYYPTTISTSLPAVSGSVVNEAEGQTELKFYYNQIIDAMRSYNGSGTVSENYIANITVKNCTIGDEAIPAEDWGSAIYFPGAVGSATNFVGLTGGYTIQNNTLYGGICICEGAAKDATAEQCIIKDNTFYDVLILNGKRPTGWNYNSLTVFPTVTGNTFKSAIWTVDGHAYFISSRDGDEAAVIPAATLENYLASNTFEVAAGYEAKVVIGSYAYSETATEYYGVVSAEEAPAVNYVAQIGDQKFETFAEALAAAGNGDVITLLAPVTIAAGEELVVDKHVVYTSDVLGESMFVNNGKLTIAANGYVEYVYTGAADTTYGKGNYAIENRGELVVNGNVAVAVNDGIHFPMDKFSHALYAINNNGTASATINSGLVVNYNGYAIRQVASGTAHVNTVTVNGGEILGARAVWMQAASSNTAEAPTISLVVNGGKLEGYGEGDYTLSVYSYSYGNNMANMSVTVTGGELVGDIALTGGKNKTNAETVTVTGGKVTDLYSYASDEVACETIQISGGTFEADVSTYLADGYELDENGAVVVAKTYVAQIGDQKFESLQAAIDAANGGTVEILCDISESLAGIENVTLITNVAGGVTITNTFAEDEWIAFNNVTLGSGVTLITPNVLIDGSTNIIEGVLMAGTETNTTTYYQYNDAKTIVRNGGQIIVSGDTVLRCNYSADSGIFIYGDGDDTTVEYSSGLYSGGYIGAYSGTFYAENAVVNAGGLRLDFKKGSSEEADKYAPINAEFVNSTVSVMTELRLYKDATMTLTGSSVTAGKVQVREAATPVVAVDSNSSLKADTVEVVTGALVDAILGEDNTVSFKPMVAQIGTKTYSSLQDAINAATAGQTVTILTDIELTETLTIAAGKDIILELNGKSISQTKAQTGNYQMILNDGKLTIQDSSAEQTGKLSYTDTVGGNFISNTITNRGTLILKSGTVENLSSQAVADAGFPYAIDTSIWGAASEVNVIIEGGKVYCESYSAIRLRADSETKPVNVTVTGGAIYGRIEVQNPTSNKATVGKLTISGGIVDKNNSSKAIMVFGGGGTAENMKVEITGGEISGVVGYSSYFPITGFDENVISGGTFDTDVSEFLADGYQLTENENGTFGVEEKPAFIEPTISVENGVVKYEGTLNADWRIGIFYIGTNEIPEVLTSGAAWNALVAYGKQYPSINGANGYKNYANGAGLTTLEQGGNWVLFIKYPTEVEGKTVYKAKFISYTVEVDPGEFKTPTVEVNTDNEIVLTNPEHVAKLWVFYVGDYERSEYTSGAAWNELVKEGRKYAINGTAGYRATTDMNGIPELTERGNYVIFMRYIEDGKTKTVCIQYTVTQVAEPYHKPEATIVDSEIVLNFHEDDTFQKVYLFYTGETTFTDTTSAAAWTALVREGKKYDINGANGYQVTTDPENLPAATEAGQYYVFVRYTDVNDATRTVVVPVVVE